MRIAYREIYPGFKGFDCDRLHAALGREQCADNFRLRRCVACWDCPTGKHHAGIRPDAPQRPKKACVRCGSMDNHRLIADCVCVSCYNRQREVIAGKNCKGVWPTQVARQLSWVFAIVRIQAAKHCKQIGNPPNYARSGLPRVEQIEPGFYFVQMVATGKTEFESWLARHYPDGEVIDYDEGASFAVSHSAEKSAR